MADARRTHIAEWVMKDRWKEGDFFFENGQKHGIPPIGQILTTILTYILYMSYLFHYSLLRPVHEMF